MKTTRFSFTMFFLLGLLSPMASFSDEPTNTLEWRYDDLTSAADLIVVGTLQSTDHGQYSLYRGELLRERFSRDSIDVVVSRFNVAATLKGHANGKRVDVVHVLLKENVINLSGIRLADFATTKKLPVFVVVEIDGNTSSASNPSGFRTITPEYLLFLKRRDDGRYELVSGDTNGRASVRTLNLD